MHSFQMLIQNQNLSVWGGGVTNKMRLVLQQILKKYKVPVRGKMFKCFRITLKNNRCSVWLQ